RAERRAGRPPGSVPATFATSCASQRSSGDAGGATFDAATRLRLRPSARAEDIGAAPFLVPGEAEGGAGSDRHATVHYVDGAGGIGALVGGEVERQGGDLLGRAQPAHRLAGDEGGAGLLIIALGLHAAFERRRLDRAGTDGAAADAAADE